MLPENKQNKDVIIIDGEPVKAERLENWKNKYSKIQCGYEYQVSSKTNNTANITADFKNKDLTENQKNIEHVTTVCAATGSASHEYSGMLISQTISAFFTNDTHDGSFTANAIRDALIAMNPADEVEGMLCSRLLVIHNQYMHSMARVTSDNQTSQGIDLNINRATKLMRVYNETLDALNRYRRKGEQKVTVQHVNVNNGGKAIVTSNLTGGGDNHEKQE